MWHLFNGLVTISVIGAFALGVTDSHWFPWILVMAVLGLPYAMTLNPSDVIPALMLERRPGKALRQLVLLYVLVSIPATFLPFWIGLLIHLVIERFK